MGLLKKENWIVNAFMMVLTLGTYVVIPASLLKLYNKDEWYSDYRYWLCGALMLFFPIFVMLIVLAIQMTVKLAKYLNIAGENIYGNVYVWIGLLIVPVVGWTLLLVMYIYLQIFILSKFKQGIVEKELLV